MEQELREKISALVQRAQVGDLQAKEEIYRLMVNKVYYLALKIVKNDQDAMDIMQESFIKAFNKLDTLTDTMAFTTWLYRITSNNSKNLLTRGKKEIFSIDSDDENSNAKEISDLDEEFLPQSAVDNKETQRLVKKIIDELPDAQRSCIMMYYFGEMSVKEIAETLDCSEGTVKSRLNYARKQIKEAVLTLEEREGTKLYNIAPFGLLVLIISSISNEECLAAELTQQLWQEISTDVNLEANEKLTTKEASTTTKVASVISGKIIAGVIVAAVAIGGVVVASNMKKDTVSSSVLKASEDLTSGSNIDVEAKEMYDNIVSFEDPAIEMCIRQYCGKTTGDIYEEDLEGIKSIMFLGEYAACNANNIDLDSGRIGRMDDEFVIDRDKGRGYLKTDYFLYSAEINDTNNNKMKEIGFIPTGRFNSLEDLKTIKSLEDISFLGVPWILQEHVNELAYCNNLESVYILAAGDYCKILDFSDLPYLKVLDIQDRDYNEKLTTAFDFSNISNLVNIENLTIQVNNLDNIDFVQPLNNIKSLFVSETQGVDDLYVNCNIFEGKAKLEELTIQSLYEKADASQQNNLYLDNTGIVEMLPSIKRIYIPGENIKVEIGS